MGLYSRAHIERIISENGHSNCHYCGVQTRKPNGRPRDPDHATIDHKVPKARGGSNDPENLLLACNACNNAKGDRTYEDFVARPYRVKPAVINGKFVDAHYGRTRKSKKTVEHPAYKARGGTLAAAIESGEVTEECRYSARPASETTAPTDLDYHKTVYCLTGKKVPKRSEIFEPRGKKRVFTEKEKEDALAHIYKGREYLLRTG